MTTPQNAAIVPDPDEPLAGRPDGTSDTDRQDATDPGLETEPNRPIVPDDASQLDPGEPHEPVGNDNIREGRVGGVMGGPRQQQGQGQGG
jgi:hypothetical protein